MFDSKSDVEIFILHVEIVQQLHVALKRTYFSCRRQSFLVCESTESQLYDVCLHN